ncbi:MAG: RluA family pseudouridine synthase [Myxococcota bacterium]|nr:RluA family pseudouridine synthase [Myxococcota bacterium]
MRIDLPDPEEDRIRHKEKTGMMNRPENGDQRMGRRLDAAVREVAQVGLKRARQMILTGKIFVDDKRILTPSFRIQAHQELSIRWAAPKPSRTSPLGVHAVYTDDAMIVINKPAGLLSTPTIHEERETALHAARRLCRGGKPPLVVHRLDKETSGLMIFARGQRSARNLRSLIDHRDVRRTYRCIVHGCPPVAEGTVSSALLRDAGGGRRGSRPHSFQVQAGLTHMPKPTTKHGKWSITKYRVVNRDGDQSALECMLETGRTHQIRIHLAELGHPILGERVYAKPRVKTRQALHAATLRLPHPLSGEALQFMSDWPADLQSLLTGTLQWSSESSFR